MIILKLIFIGFLFVVFMGIFFVVRFLGNFQSMMKQFKNKQTYNGSNTNNRSYNNNRTGQDSVYKADTSSKTKIIPKDEGEYVDFEEVKE